MTRYIDDAELIAVMTDDERAVYEKAEQDISIGEGLIYYARKGRRSPYSQG